MGGTDDIELQQVMTHKFASLELSNSRKISCGSFEFNVTQCGSVGSTAMITVHDIGLNHKSNFSHIFSGDAGNLLKHFHIYHIDLPVHDHNDEEMTTYPTMNELSDCLGTTIASFGITSFVGLASGAGAYLMMRYALLNKNVLLGMILVNPVAQAECWYNWTHLKISLAASQINLSNPVLDYLLWYHIGNAEPLSDLYANYKLILNGPNPGEVLMYVNSFMDRKSLPLVRPDPQGCGDSFSSFGCPSLIICGRLNPRIEEATYIFSKANPVDSSLLEISDCRDALSEAPSNVFNAIILFLQGLGFPLTGIRGQDSSGLMYTTY